MADRLHVVLGFSDCVFFKNEQINYLDVAVCDIVFCVAGECQILYRGRRSHNEVVDLSMAVYGVGDRNYVSPLYSACPLACQVLSKVCSFLSSLSPRLACAMLCYACVRWQVRHVSYAWLWCVQCGTLNLCFVLFLHKAVPKPTRTKHHG